MTVRNTPRPTRVPDPDNVLVARFRAGDRAAFGSLVRQHQPAIRQLILRYVHSDADANDLAQTAMVNAFERIADFRGDASFRTWLYRIAINLALNHLRGAPAQSEQAVDVATLAHTLETSRVAAGEIWRKVSARLDELPPKQRLVLELRIFHDLTFKEVAALADCSEESAKANFHHAVKRLRDLLPPTL